MPKKSLLRLDWRRVCISLCPSQVSLAQNEKKNFSFNNYKDQESPPRVCAGQLGDQDVPGSASGAPHLCDGKCLRVLLWCYPAIQGD